MNIYVNARMNDNLQKNNTCAYIHRMETIGSRLDLAMKEAGYKSQMALSNASDVPQPTISRILKGKSEPEAATIAALAVACRVATEWLMTGRGNKYVGAKQDVQNVKSADAEAVSSFEKNLEIVNWPFSITYEQYLSMGKTIKDAIEKFFLVASKPYPISNDDYSDLMDFINKATFLMRENNNTTSQKHKTGKKLA